MPYVLAPSVQCVSVRGEAEFHGGPVAARDLLLVLEQYDLVGRLGEGETLLVQGGWSGLGMAVIRMTKLLGCARVCATAGSAAMRAACIAVGAAAVFDYRQEWAVDIRRHAGEHCLDVTLDAQAGRMCSRA